MRRRNPELAVVATPVWGPEPIGASMIDALDAVYGANLAGAGMVVGWGMAGSPERSDARRFASPQFFAGGWPPPGGVPPVEFPATGLPSTTMPVALVPWGTG